MILDLILIFLLIFDLALTFLTLITILVVYNRVFSTPKEK